MAIKDLLNSGAVFDGDLYSSKYFGVSQNFVNLTKGRNVITLSPSELIVKGTPLQVEMFDSAGKQVSILYTNQVTANQDLVLNITIKDDTNPGRASLWIAGTASRNFDTGRPLSQTKANIVWVGISDIKLNKDDITPTNSEDIVLSNPVEDVTVTVSSTDKPYQNQGEDRHKIENGTGVLTYYPTTDSSTISDNVSNRPQVLGSNTNPTVAQVSGQSSTSGRSNPIIDTSNLPTIVSTVEEFTAAMVNGVITITPDVSQYVPPSLLGNIGSIPAFLVTIIEVVNSTTIKVDTHFTYEIPNSGGVVVDRFTSGTYNIEYNENVSTSDGQKVTGYAKLCFSNTATTNGVVDKVRVSAKPVGAVGGASLLGDFDPIPVSKLQDTTAYKSDPVSGLNYKPVGQLSSQTDVDSYLDVNTYQLDTVNSSNSNTTNYTNIGAGSATQNSTKLLDSVNATSPAADDQVTSITINDSFVGSAKADTEYELTFDAYSEYGLNNNIPVLDVYVSGPAIKEGGDFSTFGTKIASIQGSDKETQRGLSYYFTAVEASNTIKPNFVLQSGTWHITNIDIKPGSSTGNTPNEFCVEVPLDNLGVNKIGEEYVFETEFIGKNGKPLGTKIISQGIILNENATMDENLVINTFNSSPTLQNAISGSFNEASASIADDIYDLETDLQSISGSIADDIYDLGIDIQAVDDRLTNISGSLSASIAQVSSSLQTVIQTSVLPISGSLIKAASFGTGTGDLTLTKNDDTTITVNLDGRYLTVEADTLETVTSRGAVTYNPSVFGAGICAFDCLVYLSSGTSPTSNASTILRADKGTSVDGATGVWIGDGIGVGGIGGASTCFNSISLNGADCANGIIFRNLTNIASPDCGLAINPENNRIHKYNITGSARTGISVTTAAASTTTSALAYNSTTGILTYTPYNHPNHTGDVTGTTALTIQANCVTYAKMQDVSEGTRFLGRSAVTAGNPQEIDMACARTMLNVAEGATSCQGTVTTISTNNGVTGGPISITGTIALTGQALALHNLATNGIITRTAAGSVSARTIVGSGLISVSNGNGVSGNPTISTTATSCTGTVISVTANGALSSTGGNSPIITHQDYNDSAFAGSTGAAVGCVLRAVARDSYGHIVSGTHEVVCADGIRCLGTITSITAGNHLSGGGSGGGVTLDHDSPGSCISSATYHTGGAIKTVAYNPSTSGSPCVVMYVLGGCICVPLSTFASSCLPIVTTQSGTGTLEFDQYGHKR